MLLLLLWLSTEECHAHLLLILKSLHLNEAYWMWCWHKQRSYTSSLTTTVWFLQGKKKNHTRNEIRQQEIIRCSLIFQNSKANMLRRICYMYCYYCLFILVFFLHPSSPLAFCMALHHLAFICCLVLPVAVIVRHRGSLLGIVAAYLWLLYSPRGCMCSSANVKLLVHFWREN